MAKLKGLQQKNIKILQEVYATNNRVFNCINKLESIDNVTIPIGKKSELGNPHNKYDARERLRKKLKLKKLNN